MKTTEQSNFDKWIEKKGLSDSNTFDTRLIEKGFWDVLSRFFHRSDATAQTTTYGIDAADAMQDQEYVVWGTAEDERVCNYCGPLDLKIVST
ncbi:hypothetical protein E6H33_06070 [Candidatus Bathyarchaeota archaeon]|nr:MAG: hypothetical protein E6H33_06070 [Candidatus Bathyarchaeota archaeon]